MKPDPCPLCGVNRNLVGYRHNCVPRPTAKPVAVDNEARRDIPVDNGSAKTSVINTASAASASSNAQRQAKWRAANRDKHRERNRNLMRQKRATQKNTATAA